MCPILSNITDIAHMCACQWLSANICREVMTRCKHSRCGWYQCRHCLLCHPSRYCWEWHVPEETRTPVQMSKVSCRPHVIKQMASLHVWHAGHDSHGKSSLQTYTSRPCYCKTDSHSTPPERVFPSGGGGGGSPLTVFQQQVWQGDPAPVVSNLAQEHLAGSTISGWQKSLPTLIVHRHSLPAQAQFLTQRRT